MALAVLPIRSIRYYLFWCYQDLIQSTLNKSIPTGIRRPSLMRVVNKWMGMLRKRNLIQIDLFCNGGHDCSLVCMLMSLIGVTLGWKFFCFFLFSRFYRKGNFHGCKRIVIWLAIYVRGLWWKFKSNLTSSVEELNEHNLKRK